MKVYISVDVEGLTGSTSWESTNLGNLEHGAVAEQMKREAMAAALGAIDAGADEVYIKDAHDSGRNMDITGFPKQCRFIRDWTNSPDSMIGGIDKSFDAVLFVGYHSPAGFDGNPLSHTMNRGNNYVKFNGELCSEFLMHAFYAAELGVPSVFLSGDRALCSHVHTGILRSAPLRSKKDSVRLRSASHRRKPASASVRQPEKVWKTVPAAISSCLKHSLWRSASRIITEPTAPATIQA